MTRKGKGVTTVWMLAGLIFLPVTWAVTNHDSSRQLRIRSGSDVNLFAANQIKSLTEIRMYALALVNQDRQAQGLNPLIANSLLDQVAQTHAEDMLQKNYFDHRSLTGTTPQQRYLQAGGNPRVGIGENIFFYENSMVRGLSAATVKLFQENWMNSPGHRQNILNPEFVEFGYGIVYGPGAKQYAVQLFATKPD